VSACGSRTRASFGNHDAETIGRALAAAREATADMQAQLRGRDGGEGPGAVRSGARAR